MTTPADLVEALPLAEALRRSRWVYPLVNAGHVLGIALLIGAVIPMDVALIRRRAMPHLGVYAGVGFAIAAICGGLLFVAQATEYVGNFWFRLKFLLLALALANAALHLWIAPQSRTVALASLLLWPSVLVCGRLVAYS